VLDKGDRTAGRDRVRATFASRGYRTGLLDNTAINAPADYAAALADNEARIDIFLDAAHAAGRRVLVVDDGGLLARGYGHASAKRRVDAALELTVSGIKRINAVGELGIPVLNMARSQVKTLLGYPEIADSCLRRLRTILPDRKMIGRPVLLLGYGTLGSRLAPALRALGCRVTVVDTDLLALIAAAEAGYTTYRTAAEALRATTPLVVMGTTGEIALTEDDLPLLPDGTLLAPFATRDFSVLTSRDADQIPGVGLHCRLSDGRHVTVLGDGRSLNLFGADSIGPEGYDAYRAGTLIAAAHLCTDPSRVPPGLHTAPADQAIDAVGLFEAYYNLHLAPRDGDHAARPGPAIVRERPVARACVVGYGTIGRLHTTILDRIGADLTIIDPKHQDLPGQHRTFVAQVSELPATVADGIDLWSVCCPTADHLPVLRAILDHRPAARVLLEKPACPGDEIDAFLGLLARHPAARVVVNDQYRHSTALDRFTDLIRSVEPDTPPSRVAIAFTKDRRPDITTGRFIDRHYGVLGYEWLHMLAVLAGILPAPVMDTYLASEPSASQLWATYDPQLFVSALTERLVLDRADHDGPLDLDLTSSILGPSILLGRIPEPRSPWRQGIRPTDNRHRHVAVHAGSTHFTLHLDPVTARDGWQLERNHHRLTAERGGRPLHDETLHDSPLETSIRHAVTALTSDTPLPPPNLAPLQRIARLAEHLRHRTPDSGSATSGARAIA
jgi:S-adenosylhomocysteine hydrolase